MSGSRESRSCVVMPRGSYIPGTYRFRFGAKSIERVTFQWSVFSTNGGATASIRFYAATVDDTTVPGVADPLSNTDPTVNRFWGQMITAAGTPIRFVNEPAGVPGSEPLPFPSICLSEILVEVVVAGATITDMLISARDSA